MSFCLKSQLLRIYNFKQGLTVHSSPFPCSTLHHRNYIFQAPFFSGFWGDSVNGKQWQKAEAWTVGGGEKTRHFSPSLCPVVFLAAPTSPSLLYLLSCTPPLHSFSFHWTVQFLDSNSLCYFPPSLKRVVTSCSANF